MKSTLSRTLSLLPLSLAFTACGPAAAAPVHVEAPAPLATPATGDELKALARKDNAFAVDLYARARAQKGNLVMSPFSIATALSMTLAGAKGETAAQMAKVLHLDGPADRAVDVAGSLVASYGAPDNKVTVRVANHLFGEKSYSFEAPFTARLQAAYGAPMDPLDFRKAPEPSRVTINAWVAGQTQDRIKDLVPVGGVDSNTRLALVNAIYFLGDWVSPFEKAATSAQPFFTGKTDQHAVSTMHQIEQLRLAATDGVKVLELPYQGGALAMDIVLPDAVDGLDAVEARLTPAVLDRWIGAAQSDNVAVSLPKFEIAPQASLSLGPTLSAMGMPLAFEPGRADLTGIANPKDPADKLYVSAVFHKGFIKVDEKGTEAAAASAVIVAVEAATLPRRATEFKADHPFLYLLRDTRSGLVLFMGRVADPAAK